MPGNTKRKTVFKVAVNPPSFQKMAVAWWDVPKNPQIYGAMNVEMSEAMAFLDRFEKKNKVHLTVTGLVAKVLAQAYKKYPQFNAKAERNNIYIRKNIDIMLLVSADEGSDLSGIKMLDVDKMSLLEVARTIAGGAKGVRRNKGPTYQRSRDLIRGSSVWTTRLLLDVAGFCTNRLNMDLSFVGFPVDPFGTAMISSVGMFGIETAYAPLLPHARCGMLLVVTEVRDKPWVADGKVVVRPVMKLCGTFDHRIFTGYQAALLASYLKDMLQDRTLLEAL